MRKLAPKVSKDLPFAIICADLKLMKVGCALLQPLFGGVIINNWEKPLAGHSPSNYFNSEVWLIHPTPDMKAYSVWTREEFHNIQKMIHKKHKAGAFLVP